MPAVSAVAEPLTEPVGASEGADSGGIGSEVRVFVLRRVVSASELPHEANEVRKEILVVVLAQARVPLTEAVVGDLAHQRLDVFDRPGELRPNRKRGAEDAHAGGVGVSGQVIRPCPSPRAVPRGDGIVAPSEVVNGERGTPSVYRSDGTAAAGSSVLLANDRKGRMTHFMSVILVIEVGILAAVALLSLRR